VSSWGSAAADCQQQQQQQQTVSWVCCQNQSAGIAMELVQSVALLLTLAFMQALLRRVGAVSALSVCPATCVCLTDS
jgi:HD-like signal output (HDOD) protein